MRNRDPKPTGGSWWMQQDRIAFYEQIAQRFAVNKGEQKDHGWHFASDARPESVSRGGKSTARNGSNMGRRVVLQKGKA